MSINPHSRRLQSGIFLTVSRVICLMLVISLTLVPVQGVLAAATLTVTPITWNVIGLDSNDVTVGPDTFPIGVRIKNTSTTDTATNIQPTFVWDTTDPYINLRPGSYGTAGNPYPVIASLAPGAWVDVYFEVRVTRNSAAYDHKARYHIAVTADGGVTASSPTPRELYVEHLISQSRNANFNVYLNGVAVPVGGEMNLYVNQTYTITLTSKTATGGYEQIESFINFPNTIFKINSVTSTYSTVSGGGTTPTQFLYNDACTWENDPNSPNYRSCLGVGKAGNEVVNTYNITIISGGGTEQILSNLVYDFSGSSYHYNSDASTTFRIANIIDPTSVTISKNFNPDPTNAGGTSVLTLTLTNPNTATVTGANFTDRLPNLVDSSGPGIMRVASTPGLSTSGCGTSTFTYTSEANYDTLNFSNGSIAANSTCVIKVNVTVPVTGTYTNTSGHLYIGSIDTNRTASDTLTVNITPAPPACTPGLELATWTIPTTITTAPPAYTFKSSLASSATSAYSGTGTSAISTTIGNPVNSWGVTSGWSADNTGYPNSGAAPYFEFSVDTSKFSDVRIKFDYKVEGNWAAKANNHLYTYSSANGGTFTNISDISNFDKNDSWASIVPLLAQTTGTNTTTFRINAVGQQQTTAALYLDNIIITGCAVPLPTLTKAFSPNPIAVNGTSTLTFTLSNENNVALTGVKFTDDLLPAGLQVVPTPASPAATTTCGGTPTWAPTNSATILTFGDPVGATIPARATTSATAVTCTVSVNVTATTAGPHQNISGFISSAESGTNITPSGYGTASLTAILPPVIEKSFTPDPILTGGTSTLKFTLTNPNTDYPLSSVAFNDTLPTSPGAMTIASPLTVTTSGCGSPTFSPALAVGGTAINFRTGTIAAGGTCTISVNVTATATGKYTNTTGKVSTVINGSTVEGNTASDTLDVQPVHPTISLLKQASTSSTGPWSNFETVVLPSNIYYRFAIENTGDVPLSPVTINDPTVSTASCAWVNGDGTPVTAPITLPVADSTDLQHIIYCVVNLGTPIPAVSGTHENTATASGTYLTTTVTDTSKATYATAALNIVKSVLEWAYTAAGDLLHYSFVVSNSGAAPLKEPVVINDDKTFNESCPSTTTVGDLDAFLDPGESLTCSASYTITAPADLPTASSSVTNTASATVEGVTSNTDSETSTWSAMDYDDLPDSYATYQNVNGARHTIPAANSLFMGPSVSADNNGQPSAAANLDASDNGVTRKTGELWTNGATVHLLIDLTGTSFTGTPLAGIWLDWDGLGFGLGDFISCGPLTVGIVNECAVTVPAAAAYTVGNTVMSRVRLFDAANLIGGSLDSSDYAGLASNGEVEAFQWKFSPTSVELTDFSARQAGNQTGWLAAGLGLALAAALLVIWLRRKS